MAGRASAAACVAARSSRALGLHEVMSSIARCIRNRCLCRRIQLSDQHVWMGRLHCKRDLVHFLARQRLAPNRTARQLPHQTGDLEQFGFRHTQLRVFGLHCYPRCGRVCLCAFRVCLCGFARLSLAPQSRVHICDLLPQHAHFGGRKNNRSVLSNDASMHT